MLEAWCELKCHGMGMRYAITALSLHEVYCHDIITNAPNARGCRRNSAILQQVLRGVGQHQHQSMNTVLYGMGL